MRIEFDVSEGKVQNFTSDARSELSKHSLKLTEEFINEVLRIEASRRLPEAKSEVTQSDVRVAAHQSRMIASRRRGRGFKLLQVISSISSLIAGGLFDVEKFKSIIYIIVFICILVLVVGTNVYLIFNQDNNG